MNGIASSARRVWKSAQLSIGFHRDLDGNKRDAPHVWQPKNGGASIHENPAEQETFMAVKSANGDVDQDVQIKLRPSMIVLRRDRRDAWEGIKVMEHSVCVKVGEVSIRVHHNGSITREEGGSTTWVEADGGVLKKTEFVEASMSSDGTELTRRTPDNLTAITNDGLLSKSR